MPRVHHVKKARKDNPAVKKGESYYHWTPFRSGTQYSATYPRQSQLCGGKKSMIMATQEGFEDSMAKIENDDLDVLKDACEQFGSAFNEIADEYEDSAENMPENLQDTEQTENMRAQADSLREVADALEDFDFEFDDWEDDEEYEDKEDWEEAHQEFFETVRDEAQSLINDVEILF